MARRAARAARVPASARAAGSKHAPGGSVRQVFSATYYITASIGGKLRRFRDIACDELGVVDL